jgi:hypothetical protein
MQSAPQPPSLNLPDRVTDLSAIRTGNQVSLTWTMPKRNTDKLLLKGNITVRVCRNQVGGTGCDATATLQLAPDAAGVFKDSLPSSLASGTPHRLIYFVELDNRKGRTAGLSNDVEILAGEVPPAVAGLTAAIRKNGVLLTWAPAPRNAIPSALRLVRKLVSPQAAKPQQGPLAAPPEPQEQILMVETGASTNQALDSSIHFGDTYEYRAQRVVSVPTNGQLLELASPISEPVSIFAANVFPPSVPRGLAAVATAGENGNPPAIDLSWLPDTDADLAGYIIYRHESSGTTWQRVSPAQPVVGPGFHDADVQPGHIYIYAVSAIGQNGHESARSVEAQETVPAP